MGQHLLYSRELYEEPELYGWVREKRNSQAEVDYLISEGPEIIPVKSKPESRGL
jgi:hypothetical protein